MVFIIFLSLILLIEQIFFFLSRERLQWKSFYFSLINGKIKDCNGKRDFFAREKPRKKGTPKSKKTLSKI